MCKGNSKIGHTMENMLKLDNTAFFQRNIF